MKSSAMLILSTWIGTTAALGAPGELDPTFGANGILRIGAPALGTDAAATVFARGDGGFLVGRANDRETPDFSLLRFDSDGTPESSFGSDGRASADVPGFDGVTFAVMQQPDGKVVAGGTLVVDYGQSFTIQPELLGLARFLGDGRLDTGFGENGIARVDFSDVGGGIGSARANAIVQQNDGKLVAAGTAGYMSPWDYGDFWGHDMVLVRVDTVGILDPTFGTNGRVVFDPSADGVSEIRWLAQQPDGKLVAAGFIGAEMGIVRFTADGVLDPSFDNDGFVTIALGPLDAFSSADAVAVQADGKIVIGGTMRFSCDLDDPACEAVIDAAVARLNADGSLDKTFAASGLVTFDVAGAHTEISRGGLVIEPTGAIIVGGDAGPAAGVRYGFIARFTQGGALDSSFGNAGVTLIDVGQSASRSNADMRGIVRLADGDIVASMSVRPSNGGSSIALARIAPTSGGNPGVLGLVDTALAADEGADARFLVRRTGGSEGEVSVDYATDSNSVSPAQELDFAPANGRLLWLDGDTADKTIAIPIAADSSVESVEDFALRLLNPGGGATLAATDARVMITDVNANAGVLQFEVAGASVREGDIRTQLRVTRTGGSTGAVSVAYSSFGLTATESWDFRALNGKLQWAHGDTAAKTILLSITSGGGGEAEESFRVVLSAPSGGAALGRLSTMDVTIVDVVEPPPIFSGGSGSIATSVGNVNAPSGDSGGGGSAGALDAGLLILMLLGSLARRRPRAKLRASPSRCSPVLYASRRQTSLV